MPKKLHLAKVQKKDGGFYFPDFDIHILASDEADAKVLVKEHHGFDPDERTQELADAQARQDEQDKTDAIKLKENTKKEDTEK